MCGIKLFTKFFAILFASLLPSSTTMSPTNSLRVWCCGVTNVVVKRPIGISVLQMRGDAHVVVAEYRTVGVLQHLFVKINMKLVGLKKS